MVEPAITISKLDAARRQLETAITLWFNDGDPVSIHTLASAAYEIVHAVSKKRDPNRRDLIFDSALIKDEYRSQFAIWVKRQANFFKHGNHDSEAVIEFQPELTRQFFLFTIFGLEICGEKKSIAESAFIWWLCIHEPQCLTDQGRRNLTDRIPVDNISQLRALAKRDLLEAFQIARSGSLG